MRLIAFIFCFIVLGIGNCYAAETLTNKETGKTTYLCDCPCACDVAAKNAEPEDPRLSVGKFIAETKKKIDTGFNSEKPYLKNYATIKDPRKLTEYLTGLTSQERSVTLLYAALNSRVPHIQKLLLYVTDKKAVNTAFLLTMSRLDDQFYFVEAINAFIKARADVDTRDPSTKLTPLMILASGAKEVAPLERLIDKGASLNAKNEIGMTPLMYAARYSASPEVIRYLLKIGAKIKDADVNGKTPLDHLRANLVIPKNGDYDDLRAALGEKIVTQLAVKTKEFTNCIMNGDIANAREYLKTGVDINAKDMNGETLLMKSVASTKPADVMAFLIHEGADVNAADMNGDTVLLSAVKKLKDKDVIALLLRAGADVNIRNKNGDTALKRAFLFGQDKDVITNLLQAGANKNLADKTGQTPLDYARERAFLSENKLYNKMVALLDSAENSENALEKDRTDALQTALKTGDSIKIKAALKNLDVNKRNGNGTTPFLDALASSANRNSAIIRLFLDRGADLKLRHTDGTTPLMLAARNGASPDVIAQLCFAGAMTDSKDKNGKTAKDYVEDSTIYSPEEMSDLNAILSPETIRHDDILADAKNIFEPFLTVVRNGTDDDVRNLLRKGTDPNQTDEEGNTALMFLLQNPAETESLKRLLKTGADVNLANKDGVHPLTYALSRQQPADVILLLLRAGARQNDMTSEEKENREKTLKRLAASGVKVTEDTLGAYFDKGVIPDDDLVRQKTTVTQKSFIEDIQFLSAEKIAALVPETIDPNFVYPNGKTPLMLATARLNDPLRTAQILVEAGADVNATDKNGETALFYAVKNDDLKMAQWLVQEKSDVNAFNADGLTPVTYALPNKKMTTFLIKQGADLNARDKNGKTVLMNALKTPSLFIDMIRAGADVNARNDDGKTVLMIEIDGMKNPQLVKALLSAGADINARDRNGETALMKASLQCKTPDKENTALVAGLLASGADVNLRDNYGKTPLIRVVDETSNTAVIKALLKAKADVAARDNTNKTALDYAQKNTALNLEDDYGDILTALQKRNGK